MPEPPTHSTDSGTRQRRGKESRQAFLEAGAELLNEQTLESLVSSRAVATRAQRTTGSFFHYWPDLESYMKDLVDYVLRPGATPHIDELGDLLDELATESAATSRVVQLICDQSFKQTVADPSLRIEMLLWSKNGDESARNAVARFYEHADAMFASKYAGVAAAWKREPRPPFDYDTIATILTALVEGLALRRVAQPERVPDDLYGNIVLTLLPIFFPEEDDERTVEDLGLAVDSFPAPKQPDVEARYEP